MSIARIWRTALERQPTIVPAVLLIALAVFPLAASVQDPLEELELSRRIREALKSPQIISAEARDATVWIVTYLPDGAHSGSGFVVDLRRKLVVTNYHVTRGEKTVGVFFASENEEGLVTDRSRYTSRQAALEKVGAYSLGRCCIAGAAAKDLSIIQLDRVPSTANDLRLAAEDPAADEVLHVFGNPGGRPLWRWGAAVKPSVGRFSGKYSGYDVDMNYTRLKFAFNSWGGNSGGPVLNDRAEVVGVLSSSDHNGGIDAFAVHWSEVKQLLESIHSHAGFFVSNTGNVPIRFQIYYSDGRWTDEELPKNWRRMVHPEGIIPLKIRFDSSVATGFQEKTYDIETATVYLGSGSTSLGLYGQPGMKGYVFQWDRSGRALDLYRDRCAESEC